MHAPHIEPALAPAALAAATDMEAMEALRAARDLFRRTLACWASDQLMLHRRGLDVPTWPAPGRYRRAA